MQDCCTTLPNTKNSIVNYHISWYSNGCTSIGADGTDTGNSERIKNESKAKIIKKLAQLKKPDFIKAKIIKWFY